VAGQLTCERLEWQDQVDPASAQPASANVSDLTVDDYNNVFTTGTVGGDPVDLTMAPDTTQSYVQKLTGITSSPDGTLVTVTRWTVGGGAGFCAPLPGRTTTSNPCLSGIDTWPGNRYLVYYSEPEGCADGRGAIGELNISNNTVRRWCFTNLPADANGPVMQPRQLNIDHWGRIWVVTGSGHLVSLDVKKNLLTKHAIPAGALSDPFGVAPDDDVIGYTDADQSNSRVGMLLPNRTTIYAPPQCASAPIQTVTVRLLRERASVATGSVAPQGFVVPTTVTSTTDGVFVDAMIGINGGHDSQSPLGITPAKWKGQGAFFYAVGLAGDGANRVGFVRLPMPQKVGHPRDDDDPEDGYDHDKHPQGWHTHATTDGDDDDDDGLPASLDLPLAQEYVNVGDPVAVNAGQFVEYPVAASPTSLALIGSVVAADPTSVLEVDIYNALGTLVASQAGAGTAVATLALPAPGNYTVRVRNIGFSPLTHTPMFIVREPPIQ